PTPTDIETQKATIRQRIWPALRPIALPDSRFNYDFTSFIADFSGSSAATTRLTALPAYHAARVVFVAPDNCLEELRRRVLADGKTLLVTTYGIKRGFVALEAGCTGATDGTGTGEWARAYAASLDGMERVGQGVLLREMVEEHDRWTVDLLVTGSGAVSTGGVRVGKGRGFFDLEWGMLYSLGVVGKDTPAVALVHECQVVEDMDLRADVFDTVCDVVVTDKRTLLVESARKPECGILWDRLAEGMLEDIPPLKELKELQ
ncbi:uncharacterized protein K452DRAFT_195184, partial [Aplosporella prunicola CBS 121167]